jgi:hypothetical protein
MRIATARCREPEQLSGCRVLEQLSGYRSVLR